MKTKIIYLFLFVWSFTNAQNNIVSEEILITNDSIQLPGTLTYSNDKSPLIIWVHGSGNVDRNGNQAGANIKANYIKQFRDKINKENIAFFSFDKRTATKRNFIFSKNIKLNAFVTDLNSVINHFKNDTRFTEIILAGHSQGSLIAMIASKNIDRYISIAGPATSIDKTIIQQITAQSPEFGKAAEAHFKEVFETGDIKEVHPLLASVFAKQNLPFLVSWAKYNPSKEIKKLTIPVLIINGTKDLQVKIEDANALHNANPSSELVIIENMNHVLKIIEKEGDNIKSYYSPDFAISKKLITTIVAFIKK
ncbi:MAG: pimeloyl-ACP methyl ester carboxylesterase [Polaribacter sp.]|jgi:pimeloyl-ACP methyl ester carboxylesterase